MRKYFSSILCSNGTLSAYNNIYKKDVSSKVFIIYGGSDFERAVFFKRLVENFKGYRISIFNPFYDENVDGIYIENLNIYIISSGEYSKTSPVLAGIWEKYIPAVSERNYPLDLQREILVLKSKERIAYKNACKSLHNASLVKNKIHTEISPYLNEEKVVNFIHRFCGKHFKNNGIGCGEIRLLSSPTPFGIHTHYDSIFEMCNNVISLEDDTGFVSSIILGIIKDYAIAQKLPIIISPSYFANDIPQTLIFPASKLVITVNDENHKFPFEPQERLTASRFLTNDGILSSQKINTLLSVENKFLDTCVLNVYEGKDFRIEYNTLTAGLENQEDAVKNADKLTEKLLN